MSHLVLVLLAACSSSPTGSGTPPTAQQCATRVNDTEAKLVDCIQQDALWTHMQAFQQIADANPGPDGHASRNSGEPGYLASVNYVADLLRSAGYRVTIQPYTIAYSAFDGVPEFGEVSPTARSFTLVADWYTQSVSAGGDVTAQLQPVGGIIIPAPSTPSSSSGCTSADFAGFVSGRVALIQRGTCAYAQKATLAAAAGASGAIIFNEGSAGNTAATNCYGMRNVGIPVVCATSYAVGERLYSDAQAGPTVVHLKIATIHDPARADYNLIADSPYGDSAHVVVVDAHLDAIYGAGMLDNASGSATILEIALKMARTQTRNRLRYIWFGGEELGLLGSFYYTQHLAPGALANIVFDVDADVTATPNYVYAIADPANSNGRPYFPSNVVPGSTVGNDYFINYFTQAGLPYELRSNDGTDSYAFSLVGVPNTGILTGQDCCKSASDVSLFGGSTGNYEGNVPGTDGGVVDRPFLWGDNLDNNDPVVLETVSKAVASVVFNLANDGTLTNRTR
ncbi:MAG TPA: M28 family peptidase [Gemmatimonadales bacterium]|nr:M28 family peptidase [Gemmatimonadales bacterium]